jgi:hypothetical protein
MRTPFALLIGFALWSTARASLATSIAPTDTLLCDSTHVVIGSIVQREPDPGHKYFMLWRVRVDEVLGVRERARTYVGAEEIRESNVIVLSAYQNLFSSSGETTISNVDHAVFSIRLNSYARAGPFQAKGWTMRDVAWVRTVLGGRGDSKCWG